MRSPAFLIISLVSTTLFSGSSASSMTAAPAATASNAQVSEVLARSMEMIKKVNVTLRAVQAGVSTANEAKVRQDLIDQARVFNALTDQLTEAVSQVPAHAQPAVQPLGANTTANAASNTTTATVTEISPSESPFQGSPSHSSGPVLNARLASTISPKLTTVFIDEDNGIENDIVSASTSSSSSKGKITESSTSHEAEVNADNKNAIKETTTTPTTVIDMSGSPVQTVPKISSFSSISTTTTNAVPKASALASTKIDNTTRLGVVSAETIRDRLNKRKAGALGTSSSASSGIDTSSSQPAKKLMTSAPAPVSVSSIQSNAVSQAAPQVALKQAQPTPVISSTPLQTAKMTPADSPVVDELAALIRDPDAFMERSIHLDNELLNMPTSSGQTLFEIAVRANSLEVTELLLGANCFSTTFAEGENVLTWVVQSQNSEMARRLMAHTAFQGQVTMFILGAARYDRALLEFLKPFKR